jgi:hypothetical protein
VRPALEVADIFRRHGDAFRAAQGSRLSPDQRRVMAAIEVCRTAALGGHVEQCDDCGLVRIAYNSCRDRHCPKCQGLARAQWVADRRADLLPVPYFHVVFTVPAPIAAVALQNKAAVYDILLKTAAAIRLISADPRYLGAESGMIAVLHTWGQTLTHHPHVHCVVPGGGLTSDGRWVGCRPNFFLPVRVLSRLYRRLFLQHLQAAFDSSKLEFFGDLARLREPAAFAQYLAALRDVEWIVYAKRPFAGPQQVLDYLGRYTHRVAIGNSRLLGCENGRVRFRWKRLSRQQQVQGDDARCGRVHPSLPAPHSAEGLSPHSSLRLPGKRLSCQQAGTHSYRSKRSQTGSHGQARRLSRALCDPHWASYRSVPGLCRPHARDRPLAALGVAATAATTL